MLNVDRRRLLRNLGGTALALGLNSALPAHAWLPALVPREAKPSLPDPIPASEATLPQIKAEPWLQVDKGNVFLKGLAFDRSNNLTVIAAYASGTDTGLAARLDRSILRITPDKKVSTLFKHHGARLCDHAIHKDGRIFIACLTGELFVINADGSNLTRVSALIDGKPKKPTDLTFDSTGHLYVTDFIGTRGNPLGGVYRYSPDLSSIALYGPPLVTPNGIAFTPDERSMWISCSVDRTVIKLAVADGDPKIITSYALSGPGGDGIRVDVNGNMYLSMNFQGRVLVFNDLGQPIASVLLPGRDRGGLLNTPNIAFRPGTDEVFVAASGDIGGTWIYRFKGLAKGLPLYSHA